MESVTNALKAAGFHITIESAYFVGAINEVDGRYMTVTVAKGPISQNYYAFARPYSGKEDTCRVDGFATGEEAYAALLKESTPEGTIEALMALTPADEEGEFA